MQRSTQTDLIADDCADRAVHCYGTSQIFLKRAGHYTFWIRLLTFTGLVFPILAGLAALGNYYELLKVCLPWATVAGGIQVIISLWALVANWNESLQYAWDSGAQNSALATEFNDWAKRAASPPDDYIYRSFHTRRKRH